MVNVLVVEDDAEKLRRVLVCLLGVPGINRDSVADARDVNTAKHLLRERRFDLLILDVVLPERPDELPNHNAGISLLQELLARDIYFVPGQIVGLTALQDAFNAAAPRFEEVMLQVIRYDATSNEWIDRLQRVARRVVSSKRSPTEVHLHNYDLCVITALAAPELEAVLALPWGWEAIESPADPTPYYKGSFEAAGSRRTVVAAAAPRMGMTASAVLATKMLMTFRPRYLAMAGILAGVEGQCEFGDIVVADPSWDYESGKRTVRDEQPFFAATPYQIPLDPFLRGKLARLAQDGAAMDAIRRGWLGSPRPTVLTMRLGPVASGAAVIEDPAITTEIKFQHRKTIGVEMETYGVLVAADECPTPQPKAFSIKSVCDFADPRKNDDHQKYAAYTSAAALRLFVERYL